MTVRWIAACAVGFAVALVVSVSAWLFPPFPLSFSEPARYRPASRSGGFSALHPPTPPIAPIPTVMSKPTGSQKLSAEPLPT